MNKYFIYHNIKMIKLIKSYNYNNKKNNIGYIIK